MIASRSMAVRHGPGRLVVDGRDTVLHRKTVFAINPTAAQEAALSGCLDACREVYNAALQHRRDAWTMAADTISVVDQFKDLTGIRQVRPDVFAWGLQPLRGALRRLDEAYRAFFRRVRAGDTPGFPRFKGWRRFNTIRYDEPSCWKVDIDAKTLYLQGVGTIRLPKGAVRQLRRLLARGGRPVTLTITRRRAGGSLERPKWVWRACVGFTDVAVQTTTPTAGADSVVGADRGIAVTLAVATPHGAAASDHNSDPHEGLYRMPRWMAQSRDRIIVLQQARARTTRHSRAWRQLNRRIAREYRTAARRGDNWARETAAVLIATHGIVALEHLDLPAMTRSAKGTIDQPGHNVAAKQGLNRSLQDAALGRLAMWICVKAENAGRRVWLVPAANTSRRCPACGHTAKSNRPTQERFHCQACGHSDHADRNAAVNIAALAVNAETAWTDAGQPALVRPVPRMRRRKPPDPGRAVAA